MGGPSGGCIPESKIDIPVTYEDVVKTGAIMGSGGMVVMDESQFVLHDVLRTKSGPKQFDCQIGTSSDYAMC